MLTILIKELKSYFYTATGFIFMGVFLLIAGIFFALLNLIPANSDFSRVFGNVTFIFTLVIPILTMRALAEEKKSKTDQLLFTTPLKLWEIVIGKYLAAVCIFLLTLLITVIYPIILSFYGTVSFSSVFSNYFGFFLMGSAFIAIGVFISALTDNQVIAAVATLAALILISIIDGVQAGLPKTSLSGLIFLISLSLILGLIVYYSLKSIIISSIAGLAGLIASVAVYLADKQILEGFTIRFFGWFSLQKRLDVFSMGIIDVSTVVYYISFSIILVFLTIQMLEKRRWS